MKHHIAIKFIAVLLCAVTLMGAAGSAVGIFVMSELNLYDKTVDQVRSERLKSGSEAFAQEVAMSYASQTLGGCPELMLESRGVWITDYYEEGQYSYSILDSEGNVVYSYGETGEDVTAYTIPVTGKYLHLVSRETASEMEERQRATAASYSANFTIGDDARIMDALPPDGRHVSFVSLCDVDGNILYEAYGDEGVGFLYYNKEGRVTFAGSRYVDNPALLGNTIAGACFRDLDGTVVYEATASDGVGVVSFNDGGQLIFTAGIDNMVTAAAEEAPPVQAPAETVPEETTSAEIIPIFYVVFLNSSDEVIYEAYAEMSVGFLTVNPAGKALYRGYRQEKERLDESTVITDAYFYGYNETLIYEVSSAEGVGSVTYSNLGQMEFVSSDPAPEFNPVVIEETEPEEAEETEETEETQEEEEEKEPSSASDIPDETENTEAVTEPTAAAEETEVTEATEAAAVTEAPAETAAAAAIAEPAAYKAESEAEAIPEDPGLINGKPLDEYDVETDNYYDDEMGEPVFVSYVRLPMPEYTVVLNLAPNALGLESDYMLMELLKSVSGYLFPALGICLLVFAICAVYLCCSAGRKPGSDEVCAGGLNRLPLDLYGVLAFFAATFALVVAYELGVYRMNQNFLFSCILVVAMVFLASLMVVAYCYAVVAQAKTPGGYWWRNTLCMRFIMLFMQFGVWLEKFLAHKFIPFAGRMIRWTWDVVILGVFRLWEKFAVWFLAKARRFFHWLYDRLHRFFSLIPLTWQWILAGFSALLFVFITVAGRFDIGIVLSILYTIALIMYASHCFGLLSESTKRMSKGDLETKVEDKLLLGCFKDFADDLNDLADVAVVAAQKQLKSERMKTELITNVSHDIKTPLTSIINYVDLLQKPHTEEEQEQYLEVLDRQSLRLKKLIDDLMEMSKASTGNMAVEITTVDAVESVNQALGEFSDKLAAAQLTPMFRHAETRVAMRADGKLVWRVLSNILSNAVKYAMPGTRLYIDLMELEGKVVISLKNISREELNVDAEELMERFVRGDDSRNTEGSGLGLNIAKSLMELQRGQLQLLVDGDLFKVTLIFPGV